MKKVIFLVLTLVISAAQSMSYAQCTAPLSITDTGNPGEIQLEFDLTNVTTPSNFEAIVHLTNTNSQNYMGSIYMNQNNNPTTYTFYSNDTYEFDVTTADSIIGCIDSAIYTYAINTIPDDCPSGISVYTADSLTFTFTATGNLSNNATFNWDFGDGNTGSGNPVTHTFPSSAYQSYWVQCNFTDVNCTQTFTTEAFAGIYTPNSCSAPLSVTPTGNPGEVSLEYDLSNISNPADFTGFISIYNLTLMQGTGAGITITQSNNPYLYTFPDNGQHSIKSYTSEVNNPCSDSTFQLYEESTVPQPCNVTINTTTTDSLTFTFTASGSLSGNTVYNWDFGDGNTGTGNPVTHTYPLGSSQTYVLTLDVSDSNCASIINQTVNTGVITPSCNSSFSTQMGTTNQYEYNFTATGNFTSNTTFDWNFGDGNMGNGNPTTHTYASTGSYYVNLIVTDSNCTDTIVDILNVSNSCNSSFYLYQDSINPNPAEYYGYNYSTGNNLNYFWDFGDGGTSTNPFPSHTYNSLGTFNVCLTISDNLGCSDTYCQTIQVIIKASGTTLNIIDPATASIEDHTQQINFTIYPNPSNGHITITYQLKDILTIPFKLMDINGKTIYEKNLSGQIGDNKIQIDLTNFDSGMYFYQIGDETVGKLLLE